MRLSFIITTTALAPLALAKNPVVLPRALQPREDTCNDANSRRCTEITSKNLCCPTTTECIPLENKTSVICCGKDDRCDEIHPISCSTPRSKEDTPETIICGSSCCPVGFECAPSKDKCLMKLENVPEKYKDKQKSDAEKKEQNIELCEKILSKSAARCPGFPGKAIAVGFFPGVFVGAFILFIYTKLVEMKTRRRSIKSFGPSDGFPDDRFSINEKQGTREEASRRLSGNATTLGDFFSRPSSGFSTPRNPPVGNFSPNLGPAIAPARDRSRSREPLRSPLGRGETLQSDESIRSSHGRYSDHPEPKRERGRALSEDSLSIYPDRDGPFNSESDPAVPPLRTRPQR